jgi:hypothetical protein
MRIVVKIGRLSIHGGGNFVPASFAEQLRTETRRRISRELGPATIARRLDDLRSSTASPSPGRGEHARGGVEATAAARVARRLLP